MDITPRIRPLIPQEARWVWDQLVPLLSDEQATAMHNNIGALVAEGRSADEATADVMRDLLVWGHEDSGEDVLPRNCRVVWAAIQNGTWKQEPERNDELAANAAAFAARADDARNQLEDPAWVVRAPGPALTIIDTRDRS